MDGLKSELFHVFLIIWYVLLHFALREPVISHLFVKFFVSLTHCLEDYMDWTVNCSTCFLSLGPFCCTCLV